jgi:DNA repair exonuclease SbcCD ATPase subunit
LDEIANKVGNIVSESEQLKETLIGEDGEGGIVGAINLEIEAVKDITEQYATLRGQLEEVKTAYEDIATAIGAVIKAQSEAANGKTPTATSYDPQ